MLNKTCPACGVISETATVSRTDLITMQNYIYREYEGAVNAPVGRFELYFCRNCGLVFNAAFDASLMNYDEGYTAYIPSAVFENYYKEIARLLHEKFDLENGLVVDIACGKGNFLDVLCEMFPAVRGLGIDPSYEPTGIKSPSGNPAFIKDIFREEQIKEKPSLILCRHAFDQIENPLAFLESIRRSAANYKEIPFFIEVGDLDWMIKHESFSDLCYERCSFFTAESLKNILRLAGFTVEAVEKGFDDLYLLAYGTIRQDDRIVSADGLNFADELLIGEKLTAYSLTETKLISDLKIKLRKLKNEENLLAVWGIATKGVVFCNLIDAEKTLFDYCIDINPQKLNCFVPHTGHRIDAPEILRKAQSSKFVIVVMNPNYLREIYDYCQYLNLAATFIDTNGRDLIID